jgi:hypothetical protein
MFSKLLKVRRRDQPFSRKKNESAPAVGTATTSTTTSVSRLIGFRRLIRYPLYIPD